MDEWAAFVKARLDEEEAAAKAAAAAGRMRWAALGGIVVDADDHDWAVTTDTLGEIAAHIARYDPARALRDVAAGRRILARHSPAEGIAVAGSCCTWCSDDTDTVSLNAPWPCPDVLDLLSRWDGHPDYPGR